MANNFTWEDTEDKEIYDKGLTVCWMDGKAKNVQNFVEKLSEKIGHKVDWAYMGGRAHIDVLKDGYDACVAAINDKSFMEQFIQPDYDKDPDTYLQVI